MCSPDPSPSAAVTLDHLLAQCDQTGKDFERLARWFLMHDPEYAAEYAKVWMWKDWPGRWGPDKGIDLVAETHDGRVIAIQAKHYAPQHAITKQDVDTFLSESNRREIHARLLIATTDRVAANGREVMSGQEKPVSRCLRSRLAESLVQWPDSLGDLRKVARSAPKTPQPHQREALDAVARRLQVADRGQVIMACGTGKSLTALWTVENLQASKVLVLVPTLRLLRQTVQVWAANASARFAPLRVCSDVTPLDEEELGVIDVQDLGNEVTTDPRTIRDFLLGDGRRVVFGTYKSSPQIAEAMQLTEDSQFDVAICDEAHWCAGVESSSNKTILSDERIPATKRVFFTATPVLYRPADVNLLASKQMRVASMNDATKFGRVLYRLSFASAIERDLLCPYQVIVMPVTDREVERLIERRAPVTTDRGDSRVDAYSLATQIACARAMRDYDCKRMVSFHPRVEHSRMFSDGFQRAVELLNDDERPTGAIWAAHVDGAGMPRGQRNQRLAAFSAPDDASRRLLSNVKLLAEGVDVPGIDAITLIDTRRNQSQVIQMIGRAVRRAPGKSVGTVVLPVLVRGDEPLESALARSDHRPIMHILAALRAADPDLERTLDDLRVEVDPQTGEPPALRRFVLGVPAEVGAEFADAVEVMLVDTLMPSRRARHRDRRRAMHDSRSDVEPVRIDPDAPNWRDPAVMARGMKALDHDRRLRSAGSMIPHMTRSLVVDDFPLGRWWHAVCKGWGPLFPAAKEKRILADTVTWLGVDRTRYAVARMGLLELTAVELPDHIDAWIRTSGAAPDELIDLAGAGAIGSAAPLQTHRIWTALCHPSMPVEQQVQLVCKALRSAGDESNRRPQPRTFAQGFMDALSEYPRPHGFEAEAGDRNHQGAAEQYVAGWELARPFTGEALAARRLRDADEQARARRPRRRASHH